MSMLSFTFLFLVFITMLLLVCIQHLEKNIKKRISLSNFVLLISSYFFIIYANYKFALILILLTLSTWYFAKSNKGYKVGIIIALLTLAIFKYTNFFIRSFDVLIGKNDHILLKIILPLGISFYVFSAISYIVDIKNNKIKPQSLTNVALYLSFFPKLTSGPIQKSRNFLEQINNERIIKWNVISTGLQIFLFGLFKKIVLADHLSVFVNQVYKTPNAFNSLTVVLAAIAYSLQIYFDFSGYSDMAIGTAKMLGIELPRNFNLPYISHNVTEFWKRWHITLSSWLQEYLYIPLGGNRKGKLRTYLNLIITMLLGGLWHGANWTFVVWGALHGSALAIHKMYMFKTKSQHHDHSWLSNALSISVTFLFVTFCWIFFRAESINQAFEIIKRILSFSNGLNQPSFWFYLSSSILIIATIAAYFKTQKMGIIPKNMNQSGIDGYYPICNLSTFWGLVIFFVFCGLTLCLAYTGGSPFIYGNF